MSGTDLAVRDTQPRSIVRLDSEQFRYIANTEFVPQGLRGNLPAIMACVAMGRELGIGDMQALQQIYVVNGRPTLSAELMTKLVRRAGHSITGEWGPESCTVVGRRKDNGDEMRVTWTIEMAKRAGLAGKGTWKAYPEAMLFARAVSQLCRMLFADVFAGGTYTPDELNEDSLAEGEPVSDAGPSGGRAERVASPSASEDLAGGPSAPVDPPGVAAATGTAPPSPAEDADYADVPEALRPEPDDPASPFISAAQRARLWTIATAHGVPEDELRAIVERHTGQQSTTPIPRAAYEAVCAAVEAWEPPVVVEPTGQAALRVPDEVRRSMEERGA